MPELIEPTGQLHAAWLEARADWGPGVHEDGFGLLTTDDVEMLRFDELTSEHAELEGASSLEALRTGLRHHYPHLVDDACISVVRFHLVAACPS